MLISGVSMLNILRNLGPKGTEYYVAFSGGVDSVALAHRLIRQGYAITLLCVDHLDEWSKKEMEFTLEFAEKYNVPFLIRSITQLKEPWE
jgi:tRNA(Ile)-lysidine synthase TilS/MesJ